MKNSFKLIKLISIVSQTFLPQGGYPGLMEVCQFLINRRNEATIDIGPILNATKAEILKQHEWIGKILVPQFRSLKHLEKWYAELLKTNPENVEFEKPTTYISKQEIFNQTLAGLSEAINVPVKEIKKATRKSKKLIEKMLK